MNKLWLLLGAAAAYLWYEHSKGVATVTTTGMPVTTNTNTITGQNTVTPAGTAIAGLPSDAQLQFSFAPAGGTPAILNVYVSAEGYFKVNPATGSIHQVTAAWYNSIISQINAGTLKRLS